MRKLIAAFSAVALTGMAAEARTVLTSNQVYNLTNEDTIQATIDTVLDAIDFAGKKVQINLAHGAYGQRIVVNAKGVGQRGDCAFSIVGDVNDPVSTIIATADVDAVLITNGADVCVSGIQPQVSGTQGYAFNCQNGATCTYDRVATGSSPGPSIGTAYGAMTVMKNSTLHLNGSASSAFYTALNSTLEVASVQIYVGSGLGFPAGFLKGAVSSYSHLVDVSFPNQTTPPTGYIGTTGPRCVLYMGASYSDGSVHPRASYLPGNSDCQMQSFATYNNDPPPPP